MRDPKELTVAQAREEILASEVTAGDLERYRAREESGLNRKTLLAAIDERIADLDGTDATPEPPAREGLGPARRPDPLPPADVTADTEGDDFGDPAGDAVEDSDGDGTAETAWPPASGPLGGHPDDTDPGDPGDPTVSAFARDRDELVIEADPIDDEDFLPGDPAEGLAAGTAADYERAEGASAYGGGIDHTRTGLTGDTTSSEPKSRPDRQVGALANGPHIQRENWDDGMESADLRADRKPGPGRGLEGDVRPEEPAAITGERDDTTVWRRSFVQSTESPADVEIVANAVRQEALQRGLACLGDVYLDSEEPGQHEGYVVRTYAVPVGRRR